MAPRAEAPAPGPRRVYAAVEARDGKGCPTRIALPGPSAARRIPLYVQWRDGKPAWAGEVAPTGEVVDSGPAVWQKKRKDALSTIRPGTRILAITDPSGQVLALQAMSRLP